MSASPITGISTFTILFLQKTAEIIFIALKEIGILA
jgi:hypothetical protein